MRPVPLAALCAALLASPLAAQNGAPVDRAASLIDREEYAQARQLLEPWARANPSDARAAFQLGRAYLGEDRPDPAIEWLERAVRLDARRSEYHLQLANAYGEKAMDANLVSQARLAGKAKGAFERAVELDPESVEARFGLVQYHTLAPKVMGGDRAEARRQAQEIRRRNPYLGARAMATVHLAEKNPSGAATELEAAVRQHPDSADAYLMLGSIYVEQERHAAAADLYESLLRRKPDEMSALYQVGRMGALTGERLPRAEEALRRYLQHRPEPGQPGLAAAHWRLGMVLERQGRAEAARAEYRAAVALDPKQKEARKALERLGG